MNTDETELEDVDVADEAEIEEVEAEDAIDGDDVADDADEEDDAEDEDPAEQFSIQIEGDEEDEEQPEDTPVLRTVRQKLRDAQRELKELKRTQESAAQAETLRPRPEPRDFDYDDAKFSADLEKWVVEKVEHERIVKEKEAKQEAMQREFQERETAFKARARAIPDFDEAEAVAEEAFTPMQRGMMIDALDHPERVIAALSKRPKLLKETAGIDNPARFIAAVTRLEGSITVTTSRPKSRPEKRVSGSPGGATGGNIQKQLDRAREQAEKTGDYTEVTRLKRQLRQK